MSQRSPWVKPVLTPHRPGGMNKFGALRPQLHQSELDGVAIAPLLEQYGSPLFIVSEGRLRDNARHLRRAFSTRWPKVRHGWSYKTNYLGAVCSVLHQEGAWAEVVSSTGPGNRPPPSSRRCSRVLRSISTTSMSCSPWSRLRNASAGRCRSGCG